MPELPEVETVARDLRRLVVGATIVGARVHWPRSLREPLDPASFAAGVAGRRIESVGRRGKQLIVGLEGEWVLTVHLKMTGQLFVVASGAPEDAYVRVVVELGDGREIRLRDVRKFGRLGLYPRDLETGEPAGEAEAAGFAGLGPEPLDPGFTLGDFRRRLRGRRARLKTLLTDQAFLAGIGNIYADEALWAARLHPLRAVASIGPADEARLFRELRRILAEAVERRGSSIDDYTAPEGDGAMQERLQVYQRTGEACPRCGRPVRRIVIGARSTHFCSWCQRLPAGQRRGVSAILRTMTPMIGRTRAVASRTGGRWSELAPEGTLGLTRAEADRAAARARSERTRRVAATRRAAARSGANTDDHEPAGAVLRTGAVPWSGAGLDPGDATRPVEDEAAG